MYNNAKVDMSKSSIKGPVDENAFRVHSRDGRGGIVAGSTRRTDCAARQEKRTRIRDIVRSVTEAGNIQQQRLALRDALGHPEIRDVATSIGVNVQEAQAAVNMMNNVKGLISSV